MRWFRKAAEQGDAAAQNSLGFMYEEGRGGGAGRRRGGALVPQGRRAGRRHGAEQARCHVREGRGGLAQDEAEAVRWYRKAAEQGDAAAQYNLGWMYERAGAAGARTRPRRCGGTARPPSRATPRRSKHSRASATAVEPLPSTFLVIMEHAGFTAGRGTAGRRLPCGLPRQPRCSPDRQHRR